MGSGTVTAVANFVYRHDQSIDLEPADMCSRLELCRWINYNSHLIRNILFTDKAHFTRDTVNNTKNSHLWVRDNPRGTLESNYRHRFSVKRVVCHF